MKYFFTLMRTGLTKREIHKMIPANNKTFVLHQNTNGFFAISEYVTGFQVCDGINAKQVEAEALLILSRNTDFDYSIYPTVNSPKNHKILADLEAMIREISESKKTADFAEDLEVTIKFEADDYSG
jgi:hypothetical protein